MTKECLPSDEEFARRLLDAGCEESHVVAVLRWRGVAASEAARVVANLKSVSRVVTPPSAVYDQALALQTSMGNARQQTRKQAAATAYSRRRRFSRSRRSSRGSRILGLAGRTIGVVACLFLLLVMGNFTLYVWDRLANEKEDAETRRKIRDAWVFSVFNSDSQKKFSPEAIAQGGGVSGWRVEPRSIPEPTRRSPVSSFSESISTPGRSFGSWTVPGSLSLPPAVAPLPAYNPGASPAYSPKPLY